MCVGFSENGEEDYSITPTYTGFMATSALCFAHARNQKRGDVTDTVGNPASSIPARPSTKRSRSPALLCVVTISVSRRCGCKTALFCVVTTISSLAFEGAAVAAPPPGVRAARLPPRVVPSNPPARTHSPCTPTTLTVAARKSRGRWRTDARTSTSCWPPIPTR